MPLVVRAKYGVGPHHGHQYDLHSWATNIPGIKVVAPATPEDAKGLMKAAIRDDNPVLFVEHMGLYHGARGDVPDNPDFVVPLSRAAISRAGTDATIVASAMMVKRAHQAARALEATGIDVEIVDLRTIAPLDESAILQSVKKTGRLVVACEAIGQGSSANDVIALAADRAFACLKAPIQRVSAPPVPVPFHRKLEAMYVPGAAEIEEAVRSVVGATEGVE